jgi:DNA polymerase-3 subunit alpha
MRALWDKMAEFGRYAFNRAHGYSYATLSYWTAWFMSHYPVEATAAILSTLDKMDRMAPFAVNARRKGIAVLPPDVRFSGADFAAGQLTVTYGLSAIPHVGPAAISAIVRRQPYSSYEDFRDRSGVNAGVLYALARAGALDALAPSRKGLIRTIEADRDGSSTLCVHKDPEASGPHGLPCTYDWDREARGQELAHAGINAERAREGRKPLKLTVKEPPAKCTRACRRYTPPEGTDMAAFGEYQPSEVFRQDFETFGTWMSDRPFAQLDEFGPGMREQGRQVALMLQDAPEGHYPLAAVYAGNRAARTRTGNTMWWVRLVTEVSAFDLACFSPRRDTDPDVPGMLRQIRGGTLVFADVIKRSYQVPGRGTRMGWRLDSIRPIGN